MRLRKPQGTHASGQDMRVVLQLNEDEFMALWEKRWLRANGRAHEGVSVTALSTLLDGLREGDLDPRDVPMNLPKGRQPR